MKFKRSLTKVISVMLVLSFILGTAGRVSADELSNTIENKKQEMSETSKKINDLKSFIESKQKELSSLAGQLEVIDSRVELIQLQIRSTELEIEKNNAEIEKNENDIKLKEEEIAKQKSAIGSVLKELYKEKDTNLLSVIVGASSFSEMVNKTEYLTKIRSKLKSDLEKLSALKNELENQRKDLDKKKEELVQLKQDKEIEENTLEEQKYAKVQILQSTRGEEAEYQSKLQQARAEEQAISSEIVRLVQEQARRKRNETVQGRDGRTGDTAAVNQGGLSYPLAGVNRISVTGGDYMDPAYGMGFPHTGIDLAAKQGTPLMAAGTGTIIVAHDSGGPGLSYVAIDHGNGLITKYLHMSAIHVNTGDVVNAGDIIGLSGGSPGTRGAGIFTTGAHLHFEVNDYNGNPVNPHNYLQFAPPLF